MDIWIMVAATGAAGYVAQHWKNILRGRRKAASSFTESPTFAASLTSPTGPRFSEKYGSICKLLSGKKLGEYANMVREESNNGDVPLEELPSTSGGDGENLSILDTCVSLSCDIVGDGLQGGRGRIRDGLDDSNEVFLSQPCNGQMGFSYAPLMRKRALRTWRTRARFIKPLTSLERCLVAQLYKEYADEIEDYLFTPVHLPHAASIKPFLVIDGRRIISGRGNGSCLSCPLEAAEKSRDKKTCLQGDIVYGVPQLPEIGRSNNSNRRANGKHQKPQGSSDEALLFCLGISAGIIFLGNRQEVHKLNELLKQTENLVKDLQEELEMKDSLTVKELAVEEDYESHDAHNISFCERPSHACSPRLQLDTSTEHGWSWSKHHNVKDEEKSLSKIEAELEAELERLEYNMHASSLDGKLTDLVEVVPDFVPDVAPGELRTDYFRLQAASQHHADEDGSGSSRPHSTNYAVSPRELSVRLHEVIQSRLEERVNELETALRNSHRKVSSYMEHERKHPWKNLSNNEEVSPVNNDEQPCEDHPVIINLSGTV